MLKALERAYNRVGTDLSYYPSVRVPVILYTKKDYRSLTASPEWSGGLYDGKIRLPIGGAAHMTPMLRGVLFHEYTHVVVRELTKGNCPSWLNEGLAEYSGRRLVGYSNADIVKVAAAKRADDTGFVRSFAYVSGPLYGFLLDAASADWRRRVRSASHGG